jgi:hypothetical protein
MRPRHKSIVCVGVIAAFVMFATDFMPAVGQNSPVQQPGDPLDRSSPPPPPKKKYNVSNDYLQNLGLAFGPMPAFPNKCYDDLSISDEFFARFKATGFSLPALCLAITSSFVTYHPETGRPLTVVRQGSVFQGQRFPQAFLLEIPGCFRNGTPFLDCNYIFDETSGLRFVDAERRTIRARAILVDAAVQYIITTSGKYTRQCSCADAKWDTKFQRFELNKYCRMDAAPVCVERMSNGNIRAGSLVLEETGISFQGVITEGFTDYGGFDILPQLPRGYAYGIGGPEGDDEQPFRELTAGQKISVGPEQ